MSETQKNYRNFINIEENHKDFPLRLKCTCRDCSDCRQQSRTLLKWSWSWLLLGGVFFLSIRLFFSLPVLHYAGYTYVCRLTPSLKWKAQRKTARNHNGLDSNGNINSVNKETARPVLGALLKSNDIMQGWPLKVCPINLWCDNIT